MTIRTVKYLCDMCNSEMQSDSDFNTSVKLASGSVVKNLLLCANCTNVHLKKIEDLLKKQVVKLQNG